MLDERRFAFVDSQEPAVKKLQVQGVHHITIVGSTKQSALDFWQGALGMPFVFEQPNLGKPDENHLYFDPGDGRLLTVFTNESREDAGRHAPREIGCVEHLAFNVSRATFIQAPARLQRPWHRLHSTRPRLHGFHLSPRSQRPQDRARVLQVRSTGRLPRRRRADEGPSSCASSAATITSPTSTSPMPSNCCWRPGLAWRSRRRSRRLPDAGSTSIRPGLRRG